MTSAADRLAPAVARVLAPDGSVVGAGFLIAPDTVCTCAHVIAHALGPEPADEVPDGVVVLDFPLLRDTPEARRTYRARITAWEPVVEDGGGDIALLRLPEELPAVIRPVPLVSGTEMWGHRFRALGFPVGSEHGQWAQGSVRDRVGAGWIALSEEFDRLRRISPGFSGSPVWDEELGGVIGMVVASARGEREDTAYLVPSAAPVELQPGLRRCPYRDLEPFREEDAEFFYGREADVRRVTDAVLLTENGLSRFSLTGCPAPPETIPGGPCAVLEESVSARETCLWLVARPGHPGQVAVLFEDGHIELWRLNGGPVSRLGAIDAGVDTGDSSMENPFGPMAFLEHGDEMLVSSLGWTSLWRFGRDEPDWSVSAPSADMTVAFLNSGVFYVSSDDSNVLHPLRVSDDSSTRIVLVVYPGTVHFSGQTMEYMAGYETLKIPLDGPRLQRPSAPHSTTNTNPPN